MKTKKNTRKALFLSVISLALSFSMLLGTTFAWFTDSVTSTNNIIQSGTLDATLMYKAQTGDAWKDASEGTIFNYSYWEPGYTDAKLVQIGNAGTLGFKYQLKVIPSNPDAEVVNLAKVIDVYFIPGEEIPDAFDGAALKAQGWYVGTIEELMSDPDGAAHGYLLPESGATNVTLPTDMQGATGSVAGCLLLHMQEEAGNEYQDKTVTGGFSVQLLATQLTYENDSFGPEYDEEAEYPFGFAFAVDGVGYDDFETAWAAVNEVGGTIAIYEPFEVEDTLNISEKVTIDGKGSTLTRKEGFTGDMFAVKAGASLTLTNITLDGGAEWTGEIDSTLQRGTTNSGVTATGSLIATENNGSIVLNEGAILQNNVGAHAVNLGTRIGATLTLNGGQIINNESGSGAIWGGGHITVNEGSKINGNSSTGLAGAIRMVSSCNLTVNGGEIDHNKAAGDGGVIWGYGSSTYNFNGGEMAYNEAGGTGGAMYTGTYSVINISDGFELHDNKAANTGAIRLTDHTSMTMTGGKVYGNTQNGESNAFNTWNNSISITGGEVSDNFSFVGGLGLTIGAADVDGVIAYDLSTNHNTAYLAADFNGFKFTVNEEDEHFGNFNFKPADGYTYTEGDEEKLICLNEGYSVFWDAATGTFRLTAE